MRKEILFSFIGHIAFFLIIQSITREVKNKGPKPYPLIYRVSLVGAPKTELTEKEGGVAIVEKVKKKVTKPPQPKTEKPDKKIVKGKNGLGIKASGFEYSYYLNIILNKIGANWQNPYAHSSKKFNCTIFFTITREGMIKEVKLEKSSGNSVYDQSCLRAVKITEILPPLPEEFRADYLNLHLEFEFTP